METRIGTSEVQVSLTIKEAIHIARNPWGFSLWERKAANLVLADAVEKAQLDETQQHWVYV